MRMKSANASMSDKTSVDTADTERLLVSLGVWFPPACQGGNQTPNDTSNLSVSAVSTEVLSDMEAFADFMRMLGPPVPAQPTVSSQHGRALFTSVGCGLCHTPVLM